MLRWGPTTGSACCTQTANTSVPAVLQRLAASCLHMPWPVNRMQLEGHLSACTNRCWGLPIFEAFERCAAGSYLGAIVGCTHFLWHLSWQRECHAAG